MTHSVPESLLVFAQIFFTFGDNYTGLSITNYVSATTRTTFSTLKTIVIWVISSAIGWEKWHNQASPVRIVGFLLTTLAVMIYNNVFKIIPFLKAHNIEAHGKWMGRNKKS